MAQTVNDILSLECVAEKPYISFAILQYGVHFVMNFRRVNTGAGERIRFETLLATLFLPASTVMTDELLAELNVGPIVMSFMGPRDQMVIYFYRVVNMIHAAGA